MSKSRGNVVDPFKALEVFGTDVVRYFLLKEGNLHNDGGMCWWSSLCVCVCVWCALGEEDVIKREVHLWSPVTIQTILMSVC